MDDETPETVRPLTPKEIRKGLAITADDTHRWVSPFYEIAEAAKHPMIRATLARYCELAEMLEDVPTFDEALALCCDFHPNGCALASYDALLRSQADGYAGVEHKNRRAVTADGATVFTAHDEIAIDAMDTVALKPETAFDHSACEHEDEFIDLAICEMDTSVSNVELTTLSDCSPSVRQIIGAWERLKLVMFETYTVDASEAEVHDLGDQEEQ